MAGHVLDDGNDAAIEEAFAGGASERSDNGRIVAVGAIADGLVGDWQPEIEHGRAVDVEAKRGKILGDQPRVEPRAFEGCRKVAAGHFADDSRRRPLVPGWRFQPLHAAALLVDHNRSVAAADAAAQVGDQGADLLWRLAVALEQDEAERLRGAEEAPLVIGESRSETAEDTG